MLAFTWTDGASNGGQPILDYRVSFDQAKNIWVELQSGILTQSLTVSGATGGKTYQFKVEARNVIGYSEYSEVIAVKSAIIPTAPVSVLTTRILNDVEVSWNAPSSDPVAEFGDAITAYSIYLRTSDTQVWA